MYKSLQETLEIMQGEISYLHAVINELTQQRKPVEP